MAIHDYALTTVTRQAQFMGITNPSSGSANHTILTNLINACTDFIEHYIGYRVKKTTYTNEEYDGDQSGVLALKRFPVVSVSSLQMRNSNLNEDDWDTIDTEDYFTDLSEGLVRLATRKFLGGVRGWRVSYIAGFDFDNSSTFLSDTEGADLEYACWKLVNGAFERRKGGAGIKSEAIGDYRVEYMSELFESAEIKAILDKYKRVEVASYSTPSHY